eukprot:14625362-Alexandrium_andersonii.AAC.1
MGLFMANEPMGLAIELPACDNLPDELQPRKVRGAAQRTSARQEPETVHVWAQHVGIDVVWPK